jgi:hypothetical protein
MRLPGVDTAAVYAYSGVVKQRRQRRGYGDGDAHAHGYFRPLVDADADAHPNALPGADGHS